MIRRLIIISVILLAAVIGLAAEERNSIALIDLAPQGISAVEAAAITDRIAHELFQTGKFTVLERSKIEAMFEEMGLSQSGCTDNECIIELGKMLSAQQIVIGSVSKVGQTYSISLRMVSVETGKLMTTATEDVRGDIDKVLTESSKKVANQLADGLDTGVKTQVAKKSSSKKWWYIGGGVIAAGATAAVLAGGSDDGGDNNGTTGTLIIKVPETTP